MKNRFRLIQRGLRGGTFYCFDSTTGRRESLGTKEPDEAAQIVLAKNQAVRQPALNLQMAKAFLSASDDDLGKRTWQHAIDTLIEAKFGSTKARWLRSVKHRAFDCIRDRLIIETHAEHFLAGDDFAAVLARLPKQGPLFPTFSKLREGHRSTHFKRTCKKAGVKGVTLHSYRYAWAERAKVAGYPERFAQEALGHNSKAVHRAYARNAQVVLPSLEAFEKKARELNVVPFPKARKCQGMPLNRIGG